jgi:DNA-binding SARP family transcriptional activator
MASLKLTLFGSPQVELNGERLTFKTRKALALLAYLVVGQQPHSRETLAALFWPEFSSERAFANLRGALRSLTQPLGDSWFDIRRHEVQVRDAPTLWVDVLEFQQLLAQLKGHEHLSDTICEHCCASLLAAIDLYQDDFLRGFTLPDCPAFDEWQSFQTDLLREQLIACFQKIIAYATAQRDLLQAIEYARRWVAVCPWSEAVHRELMWVYALNSQRSEALQQYQTCVRMLRDEFEAEPEQETRALYDAIVNEELTSGLSHPTPLPQGEGALLPSHLSPSLPNRGGNEGGVSSPLMGEVRRG